MRTVLSSPALVHGQVRTPEQQELVDHLRGIWDQVEEKNEATSSIWRNTVHPKDDRVWWFTDQGAPYDLKSLEKWHQWWGTREGDFTFMNVPPLAVRIVDSVGMVWSWALWGWIDKEGEGRGFEDQRLEILHKTSDQRRGSYPGCERRKTLRGRIRMRRASICMALLGCCFLPALAGAQDPGELDEHLRFLEPLMTHTWEGGFTEGDGAGLVISLRLEPVLSGRAVKCTREVAELGYVGETHFYWSPIREEVLFLALNSRGIVGEGVLSVRDEAIVLEGVDHWPDGTSIEYRKLWQIDDEGVLKDTYHRKEDGEWVLGHIQAFIAKDRLGLAGR